MHASAGSPVPTAVHRTASKCRAPACANGWKRHQHSRSTMLPGIYVCGVDWAAQFEVLPSSSFARNAAPEPRCGSRALKRVLLMCAACCCVQRRSAVREDGCLYVLELQRGLRRRLWEQDAHVLRQVREHSGSIYARPVSPL